MLVDHLPCTYRSTLWQLSIAGWETLTLMTCRFKNYTKQWFLLWASTLQTLIYVVSLHNGLKPKYPRCLCIQEQSQSVRDDTHTHTHTHTPERLPDSAASSVETWKSLRASSTSSSPATACSFILASDSAIRTTASSCLIRQRQQWLPRAPKAGEKDKTCMSETAYKKYLTVMGMEGLLSVSLSCSFAPLLITTYLFFSFSAAAADSRGPHLLWTFRQSHTNEHTRVT